MRSLLGSHGLFLGTLLLSLSLAMAQDGSAPIPYYSSWKWILYLGIIVSFIDGYGIGANDVANSFATSVGSRSLTLRQAVFIGMFTEASGAILLGKNTSETIRGKIVNVDLFAANPSTLALGMLCASIGSASFVLFATRQGWPISTTHSIVGAICGVGISVFGLSAIDFGWSGMGGIIASWFISHVFAGTIAVVVWKFTENVVLKAPNSFETALRWIPAYAFVTGAFISFFMVYKGIGFIDIAAQFGDGVAIGVSLGIGLVLAFVIWKWYVPYVKRKTETMFDAQQAGSGGGSVELGDGKAAGQGESLDSQLLTDEEKEERKEEQPTKPAAATPAAPANGHSTAHADAEPVKKDDGGLFGANGPLGFLTAGINVDVVSHPELDSMHARVPKYDGKTELLYGALQVLTASFASFAHGSNDIANAVGPLATINTIYDSNWQSTTQDTVSTPFWIVLVCTVGLDLGLLTYGYNIMRELGNKITYHSPARGFCMELSAGFAVLTASKLGFPVSTTHCITGATLAVGLCSGDVNAVNWRRSMVYLFAWIISVPVSGLLAAVVFNAVAFSPTAYVPTLSGGSVIQAPPAPIPAS